MNALEAMRDTVTLAGTRRMPAFHEPSCLGFDHIAEMLAKMETNDFSYGKQCRWLGWAQCAVVAAGCATLDEMKEINRRHSGEGTEQ